MHAGFIGAASGEWRTGPEDRALLANGRSARRGQTGSDSRASHQVLPLIVHRHRALLIGQVKGNLHGQMVTTLTSLPPELLLKILSYLPRPTLEHHLPTPSPLISASLVSRKLGALSQELLFRSVVLNSEEEIGRWARTQARMFTTELRLEGGIIDPIAAMEVLIRGMDSRDNSRRDGLRVLEFDTLVKGAVEGRFSWGDWVGLKGEQDTGGLRK